MRIVIDARESGTSTGRHIDKLVEYLHKLKPRDEIILLTKPSRVEFFKKIAPDFKIISSDYKEFSFAEQLGFARQLYGLRPDLVHFMKANQPVLYFGRSVTTVHDLTTTRFRNPAKPFLIFKVKQLIYRLVTVWVAHKSKHLFTISEFVKNDLTHFARISPSKITVTYLAADKITEPPMVNGKLVNEKFIMYVGRPQPHKNLQRLIDAFVTLQTGRPGLMLVLAGKKDVLYERYEQYVKKQGIKNVLFTGFISEGQLLWLYQNCAAYVFPSLSEGFGLPGLEAMQAGAPVLSSSATCLPEIYGDAAHYFDPTDTKDMAAKIAQVLDDAKLRAKLVEAGKAQAAKYSWQRMAEQTLDVYKKALAK
jgi:glycosyltransferase involved in cell wall biosynthesis